MHKIISIHPNKSVRIRFLIFYVEVNQVRHVPITSSTERSSTFREKRIKPTRVSSDIYMFFTFFIFHLSRLRRIVGDAIESTERLYRAAQSPREERPGTT